MRLAMHHTVLGSTATACLRAHPRHASSPGLARVVGVRSLALPDSLCGPCRQGTQGHAPGQTALPSVVRAAPGARPQVCARPARCAISLRRRASRCMWPVAGRYIYAVDPDDVPVYFSLAAPAMAPMGEWTQSLDVFVQKLQSVQAPGRPVPAQRAVQELPPHVKVRVGLSMSTLWFMVVVTQVGQTCYVRGVLLPQGYKRWVRGTYLKAETKTYFVRIPTLCCSVYF